MTVARPDPSLTECRRAAGRLRETPEGRRARDSIRPRGVAGLFRDRAPLTLLLYLAALERRLVWQDVTGFALLEPPLARPEIWRRTRVDRLGVLRWLDRHWGNVMFAAPVPPVFALSVGLVLIFPGLYLLAVAMVMLVLVYVVVVLMAMLAWQVVAGRRETPQTRALSSVTADVWTMPLFHQENERRIDELLDRVRHRLSVLVEDEVQQAARDRGGEVADVRLSTELVSVGAGVTTEVAAERVAARFPVEYAEASIQRFDRRPGDPARRPFRPVPFFWFYVGGVVLVLVVIVRFVTGYERDACAADSCAAAPTTYGRALAWAAYRLLGVNAPGVVPVSGYTLTLGWLITVIGATTLVVGYVAARAQFRATEQEKKIIVTRLATRGRTRVLLMTVADEECDAVLDTIEQHTGRRVAPRFDGLVPVFEMGEINDTELFVVQATQGVTAAGGAIVQTVEAVRQIDPHYALIVGMCYGLKPDRQHLGDVLVSGKIRDLDPGKLVDAPDGGGLPVEIGRGDYVNPSPMLVTAIRVARREWSRTRPEVPVEVGPMLSWGKLVNHEPTVRRLRDEHPDAIGAEMEGAGFYAAARAGRVESVLIKAICDWGYDREPTTLEAAKRVASRNSAEFVLHLVLAGVFARSPARRLGTDQK